MSDDEVTHSITDAIQSTLAATGDIRMITRSLIVFESIDEHGAKSITLIPGDEMTGWDIVAFAAYADEAGRHVMRDSFFESEEEEEDGS
jgi:ribosomal protein S5